MTVTLDPGMRALHKAPGGEGFWDGDYGGGVESRSVLQVQHVRVSEHSSVVDLRMVAIDLMAGYVTFGHGLRPYKQLKLLRREQLLAGRTGVPEGRRHARRCELEETSCPNERS